MPFGGLHLFTVRSFIPLSRQNVRARKLVFITKECDQRHNLEAVGVWAATNFIQKENIEGDER